MGQMRLQEANKGAREDWQLESTLRDLVDSISTVTAESFYGRLTEQLRKALHVDFAMVGELSRSGERAIETLAVHADGRVEENFEYELEGTPCASVVDGTICIYPRNVQGLFPGDEMLREMGVEAYAGVPLRDSSGSPLGLLVVLGRKPFERPDLLLSMLEIFGWRASTELERTRTQRELEQSRETQTALLDAIPDLIVRVGPDGVVRDFNLPRSGFPSIVPTEGMIGLHIRNMLPGPQAEKCFEHVKEALRTGETQVCAFDLDVGGSTRRFEARIVRRFSDEVLTIVRDDTDRARVEEQILHTQKLESLGVLAGGVAHDFNNLLMGILGYAGLALGKLPHGSPARNNVERVQTTAQRAAELTNQMLAYSGNGHFVIAPCDLSGLIESSLPLIKTSVGSRAELVSELAPNLPQIACDENQIRQLVVNLTTNASEALTGSGTVTVSTGVTEATEETLGRNALRDRIAPGTYVYLEVADTGAGMSAETRSKIFDPFFTTKFIGRGLGLAAVLGIVRSHGGGILLDTAPQRGTRFRVLLPTAAN
jgi:signal transduction histidine kinase